MKKIFLLSSLALFACWSSKAQSCSARTRYGIYTQFGYSKPNDGFLGDRMFRTTSRNVYSLGMSVRHQLSGRWTIASGAAISYTSYANAFGETLADVSHPAYPSTVGMSWNCTPLVQTPLYDYTSEAGIEIPVMMQYYVAKDRFFLSSGIEVNAGMYHNNRSAHQGYNKEITYINRSQAVTSFQLMIPLGCGINFPAGRKHMFSIEPGIKLQVADYNVYTDYSGLYTVRASYLF